MHFERKKITINLMILTSVDLRFLEIKSATLAFSFDIQHI